MKIEEKTKQREFLLKMKVLKVSLNSRMAQNDSDVAVGDSVVCPEIASRKALKLPPYNEIMTTWTCLKSV